jgi:hypothetical protein
MIVSWIKLKAACDDYYVVKGLTLRRGVVQNGI